MGKFRCPFFIFSSGNVKHAREIKKGREERREEGENLETNKQQNEFSFFFVRKISSKI